MNKLIINEHNIKDLIEVLKIMQYKEVNIIKAIEEVKPNIKSNWSMQLFSSKVIKNLDNK